MFTNNSRFIQVGVPTVYPLRGPTFNSFYFNKLNMLAGFDGTVGEDHIYNLGIIRRTFNCPQLERYNPRKWDLFYKPPDNRQKAFQYVYPKDNTAIYLVIGIALLALLLVSCIIFLVCSKNKKKGNIKPNVQDALDDDKLN